MQVGLELLEQVILVAQDLVAQHTAQGVGQDRDLSLLQQWQL